MNLAEISINQFYELIRQECRAVMSGTTERRGEPTNSFLGLGKAGIGKTEGIRGIANELGIGCRELRLAHCVLEDVSGIPEIKEGRTVYTVPDFFPTEERDGKYGILVLDEITSATKDLRTVSLNLLEPAHKLNSYELPKGWIVVALGNGAEDGGNFNGLETTNINRCISFRVKADKDAWVKWAVTAGVNPVIIAYINFKPEALYSQVEDEESQQCATPRSWVTLSRLLNRQEEIGKYDEGMLRAFISGSIGDVAGRHFLAFYNLSNEDDVISASDVFEGKAKPVKEYITQSEKIHILSQSLCMLLKNHIQNNRIDIMEFKPEVFPPVINVLKWVFQLGDVMFDSAVLMFRDFNSTVPYFDEVTSTEEFRDMCPEFSQFINDHAAEFSFS